MNLWKLLNYINESIETVTPETFYCFSRDECEKLANTMHRYAIIHEKKKVPIVFLMIGTNCIMFDSLAPMVGSRLIEASNGELIVFGTMERPVHALNLNHTLDRLYKQYPDAYVIAIDASLGFIRDIGKVTFSPMPLQPGAGVGKCLPETGDISICGVVGTPSKDSLPEHEISEQGLEDMVCFIATSCLLFYDKYSSAYSCA